MRATPAFLADGGEMGARMRAHDWSATPLGPPEGWPAPLRTAVRLLLNTRHPMFVFWGPELICLYNDGYTASIGPERHPSALGQPGLAVWAEIWDVIGPQIDQVMSGGGATWHENHLVPITRHGRREDVYWTYSFSPIDDEAAPTGVGGVLVVCAETTAQVLAEQRQAEARARAEDALRQAQKMEAVGQLAGGIAHDFNNMLQGIAGGIELAGRRIASGRPQEAPEFLGAAREAMDRAAALTQRLLAFGRRQTLDPRPVLLDSLARGMASLIGQTVGPAIRVALDLHDGWPVRCDANQLENALLNLAINARDAMLPAGGSLLIETRHATLGAADIAGWEGARPGEHVRVTVRDTGAGMTPDVLARAFEPFFTTKPDGYGTGLGLSQVYGFVRQSGGVVRLESEVGRGTAVHLYLARCRDAPADAASGAASAVEQHPALRLSEATVLLVEDEPAIREFAAEALRERGCRVLEAADGHQALAALHRALDGIGGSGVDLLVTDVGLPGGLNGRELAEAARALVAGLPILLMTGYAGEAIEGGDRPGPGMEVLGKPFDLEVLAGRVQAMLARARHT